MTNKKFLRIDENGDRVYREEDGTIVTIDELGNESVVVAEFTIKFERQSDDPLILGGWTEGFKN